MTKPVVLSDINIALGGRPVVRHADLSVAQGEFVALLGTNGSGKSTLMRGAIGLIPIASGSARLFGTPIRDFNEWSRIGYVPQRSTAVSGVPSTVGEVVLSGTLARRRFVGHATAEDRVAAREAVELVGLSDRMRGSVSNLSGGQQQRVMIARALAGRCDLLMMDEPTAGVDQQSQAVLAELFAHLLSEGRSIWMVAHELGPLGPLVDRSVVLRDGAVVFDGPYREALSEPHSQDHPHTGKPASTKTLDGRGVWS